MILIPEGQQTIPSDINKALIDINKSISSINSIDNSMLVFFSTGNADLNSVKFNLDMNASPLLLDLQGALGA